jgi:hypothetical protein
MNPTAPADLAGVAWRKSTRSSGGGSNCVEIARVTGAAIAVFYAAAVITPVWQSEAATIALAALLVGVCGYDYARIVGPVAGCAWKDRQQRDDHGRDPAPATASTARIASGPYATDVSASRDSADSPSTG